ncbi:ATP-dependent RNA helicase DDX42 [Brachionus plicatilis]|uniref:RNA helicase n=1 Tax=Brachionus plicatilis TaxID=10195 RepID=A0A3M7RG29_BRAPC|nr:ATP-dependent RNA helicase DDX42 [Brachionus plicatilis]
MSGKSFGFSGFKLKSAASSDSSKLPAQSNLSRPAYGGTSFSMKHSTEQDYFDSDEGEDKSGSKPYQPASDSDPSEQSDDDPLDSFMASVEKKAQQDLEKMGKKAESKKTTKGTRDDIENEDDQESYFRWLEENPNAGVPQADEDDQDIEYDQDGNIIVPEKKKFIDPLPPIDHSQIDYEKFDKNFYHEHEEIKALDQKQVDELRKKLDIRVTGASIAKPVCSFAHFNFDELLMKQIRKSEFTAPTPIQAQAVPIALSGRDIIGIAKTGSGKTDAYLWPALTHIMNQKELQPQDGPIVLILAPTRELVQQIYTEAKKFSKVYNIACACAYGGGSLYEQTLACQQGVELLVTTPGRLIDLIRKKGTNLKRVTFLVLDEADRMFDMGFEPQVTSIAGHVRPDRQVLLFSATFKKKIEKLARHVLVDPVRIIQGELGEANEDITQIIKVFNEGAQKWTWLNSKLVEFTSRGKVLIFVTQKANSAELAKNLEQQMFKVGLLHGDMHQDDRNKVINDFKKTPDIHILVATDVAARGLDIPAIKTVVNYDVARDIDTHIHRIGRTGRAGEKGAAYTLITGKDKEFCPLLVRNLEETDQEVPRQLLDIAEQVPWFKSQRNKNFKSTSSAKMNFKQRERPGLGLSSSATKNKSCGSIRPSSVSAGPGTNRAAALKQAFANQFKSSFVNASQNLIMSCAVPNSVKYQKRQSAEQNDDKKKKSRWAD